MKKIILTVAGVFALTFANAQDFKSKRGENFMPEAGDWAISFQAAPFLNYTGKVLGGNASSPDSKSPVTNSFVGKKFITDKTAYRVVANFAVGSTNLTDGDVYGDNTVVFDTYKSSSFAINAGLGKEWRRGSTRLQGFYGADALLGFSSTKWTETNNPGGNSKYDAGTSINLGVNGFLGAEYFILPKMSIGAQYNYGLQIASNGASKLDNVEVNKSSSDFNLGNVSSATMNLTLHF